MGIVLLLMLCVGVMIPKRKNQLSIRARNNWVYRLVWGGEKNWRGRGSRYICYFIHLYITSFRSITVDVFYIIPTYRIWNINCYRMKKYTTYTTRIYYWRRMIRGFIVWMLWQMKNTFYYQFGWMTRPS